mmetsp:Transcript_54507/g.95218  ORF Transcript_54507/g.95218 Transcript_54507/m.95218 type:complete len:348 (+) Transcript_54507:1319-2362(+)
MTPACGIPVVLAHSGLHARILQRRSSIGMERPMAQNRSALALAAAVEEATGGHGPGDLLGGALCAVALSFDVLPYVFLHLLQRHQLLSRHRDKLRPLHVAFQALANLAELLAGLQLTHLGDFNHPAPFVHRCFDILTRLLHTGHQRQLLAVPGRTGNALFRTVSAFHTTFLQHFHGRALAEKLASHFKHAQILIVRFSRMRSRLLELMRRGFLSTVRHMKIRLGSSPYSILYPVLLVGHLTAFHCRHRVSVVLVGQVFVVIGIMKDVGINSFASENQFRCISKIQLTSTQHPHDEIFLERRLAKFYKTVDGIFYTNRNQYSWISYLLPLQPTPQFNGQVLFVNIHPQ